MSIINDICSCNLFLGFIQNIKRKSKNIIKKYNSEKKMSEHPKNGQKLVEEVQKYKD